MLPPPPTTPPASAPPKVLPPRGNDEMTAAKAILVIVVAVVVVFDMTSRRLPPSSSSSHRYPMDGTATTKTATAMAIVDAWQHVPSIANGRSCHRHVPRVVRSAPKFSPRDLTSSSTSSTTVVGSTYVETSASGGRESAGEEACTPRLRGLYDPPPSRHDDPSTSATTRSKVDVVDDDRRYDGWTTKVTSGTMPAEDGSAHVLYYEVHRRQRSPSSSCPEDGGDGESPDHLDAAIGDGLAALFLHGGPGAGCYPNHVRFFDPSLYENVILFDQRGCGRSKPTGEVRDNTLEALVSDVERLRLHLLGGPDRGRRGRDDDDDGEGTNARPWDVILGGSWGCTLAMAYAHAYPRNVRSMVLRGVCLFRPREIDWLFGDPPPPPSPPIPTTIGNGSVGGNVVGGTSNLRSLLGVQGGGGGRYVSSPSSSAPVSAAAAATTTTTTTTTTTITTTTTAALDATIATVASAAFSTTTTAAEVFTKGWEEFRRGSEPRRLSMPKSPFNRRDNVEASRPSMSTSSSMTTTTSRRETLHRYYHLLLGSDPIARYDAVRSWLRWEMGIYSSGFRDRDRTTTLDDDLKSGYNGGEEARKEDSVNAVVVWYPSAMSWTHEDARVWNSASFVSISVGNSTRTTPSDEMVQSLRRFSSSPCTSATTSSSTKASLENSEGMVIGPIPIESTVSISNACKSLTKGNVPGNINSTLDPTTYIPAQSMLTVFYSANDDYCMGRYASFLSLESPRPSKDVGGTESSWYSSSLPPRMPQLPPSSQTSSHLESSFRLTTKSSSYPLPPTIAIQGGNDAICPPDTALDLHHVWKDFELRIVVQSGHSMYDPIIAGEIVKALDRFGHFLKENE
jgi:pimeloyl-ACP methyl ester carboxylesterase